jgi:hypothetical protein
VTSHSSGAHVQHRFTLRQITAIAATTAISIFTLTLPVGAATQTVRSGDVVVAYTYHGTPPLSSHSRLKISKGGEAIYDKAVTSKWCASQCSPNIVARNRKVVHLVHLSRSGPPSVVLDLYSGGAHCCFVEQVYSLAANTEVVRKAEYNFGNPGVRLVKLNGSGSYDFLSANNDFAYAFTDFAASGMPIEIFSFSDGAFHNVTLSFPSLIRDDAAQWMKAFRSQASTHYQDSVGLVAAWAADEDMLGHSAGVARFLAAQANAGHLNSALSPITASDQKYVVALQKFLRKHGYFKQAHTVK